MNFTSYQFHRIEPGSPWFKCSNCPDNAPNELRIERPIRPDLAKRCVYVMRGHVVDGAYTSFTGLQPTNFAGVFTGDLLLRNYGKSFLIAELDAEHLTVHIAERIRVYPRSRKKVVETFLKQKPRAI